MEQMKPGNRGATKSFAFSAIKKSRSGSPIIGCAPSLPGSDPSASGALSPRALQGRILHRDAFGKRH